MGICRKTDGKNNKKSISNKRNAEKPSNFSKKNDKIWIFNATYCTLVQYVA